MKFGREINKQTNHFNKEDHETQIVHSKPEMMFSQEADKFMDKDQALLQHKANMRSSTRKTYINI